MSRNQTIRGVHHFVGPRVGVALIAVLGVGVLSAAGCGDADEGAALDEGAPQAEAVDLGEGAPMGEAAAGLSTKIACVELKRAAPLKAYDAQISKEKANTNFGSSAFVLAGASSAGPADPFHALFRFPTSTIPAGATVLSATLTLSQTNNGAATANARLILAPWDEATVTWASLGGAFSGAIFKSFSTAPATISLNLAPQVQAWVDGSAPNHGFLIEQPGPTQIKFKAQEYAVASQRPRLNVCYQVTCAPGFADCNGDAGDGCEASLSTPSDCGGCGVVCPSGACAGGVCAPPSCDDGVQNGDETGVDCGGACAVPELCNGVDDDCNGSVDEGDPGGGAGCALADPCHVGATACVAGAIACEDTGATLAAGSACGQGLVCSPAGDCVACAEGQACAPAAACMQGAITCGSGAALCQATVPIADGTACAGGTCTSGVCSANGAIAGTKNLSTDSLTAGRSCGEAVAYNVTTLGPSGATLSAGVAAGCLSPGDLVLLINEQGVGGAVVNVGSYEILVVETVAGNVVTWKTDKTRFYGSGAGDDVNIGVGAGQQKVVLQRLPVFGNLSVPAGASLTVNGWDGLKGGVLAFRAANVTIAGSITAVSKGYRSGGYSIDDSSCSNNVPTENGESVSGPPTVTTAASVGGSGGIAGGNGIVFNSNVPLSASAGHATAGQNGKNPNGRTLGPPGVAYGSGDGTNLTLGSGSGGNLTCQIGSFAPSLGPRRNGAGGIVAIFANSITVSGAGTIDASGLDGSRTPASGGYVLLRANTLSLGSSLVQAVGAQGISSGNTGTFINFAGDGYITLDYKTSLTGTTLPAALATHRPDLVLP